MHTNIMFLKIFKNLWLPYLPLRKKGWQGKVPWLNSIFSVDEEDGRGGNLKKRIMPITPQTMLFIDQPIRFFQSIKHYT